MSASRHDAIIATPSQYTKCVNRDRIIEPDGENAYMDISTLARLMEEHGETQAGMARVLGLTRDKMSKVMNGKRRLTVEEATKLSRYFGTNSALDELTVMLPIIGLVRAGSWREAVEHPRGYMPSPDKNLSKDAFVVIVEGNSMDLVAQEGEAIIVEPAERELLPGRYYIIMNGDGETTFKRYMENPSRFEPCSSDETHKPITIGDHPFTVVGRVRKRVVDL
jgi:repressor LexA